jgi:hypothetical protein
MTGIDTKTEEVTAFAKRLRKEVGIKRCKVERLGCLCA